MCTTKAASSSPFYDLNKDCFRLITEYLDRTSLRNLSQTCQKFRNIIDSTSTLDTRLQLPDAIVTYRAEERQIGVDFQRPSVPYNIHITLTTDDSASYEPTRMWIDELPATSPVSNTEKSFYRVKDDKLHLSTEICVRSLEDANRFFNEMSRFTSVEKFIMEHYYTVPTKFAWLVQTLVEAFPESSQEHSLLHTQPTDLERAVRPLVEVWQPNILMRFICRPDSGFQQAMGVNIVDGARLLTEAVVRLMQETNRTANIIRELRTQGRAAHSTIDVQLSEDKSSLKFVIS